MTDRDLCRFIIDHFEGHRYTDRPNDRGGPTRYGVTQALLSAFMGRPVTKDEMKALTLDLAIDVLHSEFCFKPKFYHVFDRLVRLCAIDFAIHSGAARGVRSLQYAALPGPPYDGVLGPITARAANTADPEQIRRDMIAYRQRFLAKVVAQHPSQLEHLEGWIARTTTLLELEPGRDIRTV
jgi:lysozyme family protein